MRGLLSGRDGGPVARSPALSSHTKSLLQVESEALAHFRQR